MTTTTAVATTTTTAVTRSCQQCVNAGNVFQGGRCQTSCSERFYSEMCFTSEAACSQVELYQQVQAKQVCQKAKTCADCLRAHKFCGWVDSLLVKWPEPSCIVGPLWDWDYGPDRTDKLSDCPPSTTITATSVLCPKCGAFKKDGKSSCCAPGGAWFKKCGDGPRFQHTWADGIDACKGICQTWAGLACPFNLCFTDARL